VSDAHASRWIKPRRLQPGDRVALVAPASPFKPEELDAGVAELARLGYHAVYDDRILARRRYVAGDPELRASALHDAWRDPSIAAIIAMRGGYGSAQLLPHLDAALMRQARKIFVGYSDVTTLLWFHLQHGLVCFHGPMIERRLAAGEQAYHLESFVKAVGTSAPAGSLQPAGLHALAQGEADGVLMGGTLTQMVASLGTPWAVDPPDGCLLFIEDVGERPYRIDRMFTQLAQAGILARARGLVLGELPSCDEPGGDPGIRDVLIDTLEDFRGPVLFGFPSGHTSGATWTLPFGVHARILTATPAVVIEEAAVC
jgi:muramoyltetrapeptide carboxypeptidase